MATGITVTFTDPDDFGVLYQDQVDLNRTHGILAPTIALGGAYDLRDAYIAQQGWTLWTSLPCMGGAQGTARTPDGDLIPWSALADN